MYNYLQIILYSLLVLSVVYSGRKIFKTYQLNQYFKVYPLLQNQTLMPPLMLVIFRMLLSVLVPVLLLLAVNNPFFKEGGKISAQTTTGGVDILFLVDVSLSMQATDQKPDRLTLFKENVLAALPLLAGNRFGIIAFAGSPFLYCPMTTDTVAFSDYIRAMNANMIADSGTDIGLGLKMAKEVLESGKIYRNRLTVLVTDGENLSGNFSESIPSDLFVFGVGTETGGPIYYTAVNGSGFVKKNGELTGNPGDEGVIITKKDTENLREIASSHDGKYYDITNHFVDKISHKVNSMNKNLSQEIINVQKNLNQYFIYLALLCMGLDYFFLEFLIFRSLTNRSRAVSV